MLEARAVLRCSWLLWSLLLACSDAHNVPGETPVSLEAANAAAAGRGGGRDADGADGAGSDADGPAPSGADGSGGADGDGATGTPADGDGPDGANDGGGQQNGSGGQADPSGASCQPCDEVASPFGNFAACCTDDGACGLDLGALAGSYLCVQQNAPGDPDPACPEQNLMGFPLPGCCAPSGTCGVLVRSFIPLGCVDPENLDGLPLPVDALPEAVSCTP